MKEEVVVALDVGGTVAKGALCNRSGQVSHLECRETQGFSDQEQLVKMLVGFVDHLVASGGSISDSRTVVGVGLAVPGIVDEAQGVAVSSMILGWHRVPFARLITECTGLPVSFGHDVRVAAHAEEVLGAARGCRDYLFVSLGTGVGTSMVLNGEAYLGAHELGGELAHFTVEPEGPPCRCGKFGCLEMVASADAVARRYRALNPKADRLSARDVVEQVRQGDPVALGVWNRTLAALGKAIAAYIELLDPELVVVGGGMSAAGKQLFKPLNFIAKSSVSHSDNIVPIIPAELGQFSGIHGAALRTWECTDAY